MCLKKTTAIDNPFEQAFFAMVHLPYLQPFENVNKRVSRLSANLPLIRDNLCPLSFVDVPEQAYFDGLMGVYELIRPVLYWINLGSISNGRTSPILMSWKPG